MTREEFQEIKGLITEVELKVMVFGRISQLHDGCDNKGKFQDRLDIAHNEWGKASNKLHNFIESLVE